MHGGRCWQSLVVGVSPRTAHRWPNRQWHAALEACLPTCHAGFRPAGFRLNQLLCPYTRADGCHGAGHPDTHVAASCRPHDGRAPQLFRLFDAKLTDPPVATCQVMAIRRARSLGWLRQVLPTD